MRMPNIIYSILLIFIFTGCFSSSNTTTPTANTQQGVDDEFAEFDDEFEEEEEEESDPFRGYNVVMTDFNDGFYTHIFKPTAKGYKYVVPKPARESINNFFHNLMYPLRLINNLLQGKFANATEETGRFIVNTTIGIFGLFDPAESYLEWKPHNEDFGQTLGYWGVGSGYHIVLPFFGPSNMRDMFSMYPDTLSNPVTYHDEALAASVFQKVNEGSLKIGQYEDLKKDAVNLYPFLKDIYEQHRKKLIEE